MTKVLANCMKEQFIVHRGISDITYDTIVRDFLFGSSLSIDVSLSFDKTDFLSGLIKENKMGFSAREKKLLILIVSVP